MANLYIRNLLVFFYFFLSAVSAATENYVVSTIAGKAGWQDYSDGIASASRLNSAHGIAVNKQSDVFLVTQQIIQFVELKNQQES
jgi:hypothetical protein